ncbi:hypothetical protein QVD17_28287 [Tagetes erecta]|uniref:F-box domain-containing protein n=1 Tax=Tagetes erecta TaxID=13708 RepID=A0AAD8KAF5_TARER|nr:hypothetical protein QVD17_28287 [Tagetes erecta]
MENIPQPPSSVENDLPGEVVSDILIRLPAKPLSQFRTVSKSFNTLISHPSFIKSHLHHSTSTHDDETLMLIHSLFCFNSTNPVTTHHSQSPHISNSGSIRLPRSFNLPPRYNRASVIGSVNGLVCFLLTTGVGFVTPVIHIWNPSLSAVMTVAPYAVVGDGVLDLHYGFGFDLVNDDYKVVNFARMFRPPGFLTAGDCVFQDWMKVEVYSMKKGSWGVISDRFPSSVTCVFDDAKVSITGSDGRDGRVHWLCCGGIRTKQIIVAFDLGVEKFSQLSLPDSVGKWRNGRANVLGLLGGKICVMGYDENGDFEVWVMSEYGVSESWVKDYAFSQFGGGIFPIGFTLNNEFVFQDDNKCLVLYDQKAAKVKSFNVTVSGWESTERFMIVPYVDSLVWIAPAN